jgi:hypothetical protein
LVRVGDSVVSSVGITVDSGSVSTSSDDRVDEVFVPSAICLVDVPP